MNENLQPVADEHLEARITAYILGESSAFEAAEIEELISKSPELRLFANRTRTLNELLKEAETTSNSPDSEWKLSGERRIALAPVLGAGPVLVANNESRIRRASFRAAWGIAAILILTFFTKRFLFLAPEMRKESATLVSYNAALSEEAPALEEITELPRDPRFLRGVPMSAPPAAKATSKPSESAPAPEAAPQIAIGGQVRNGGTVEFNEGLTLGEALDDAGGATEFGSKKRIKLHRNGKTETYDLTDERSSGIKLQADDTIEVPEKNWFGCGASRDELAQVERAPKAPSSSAGKAIAASAASPSAIPIPEVNIPAPSADFGDGNDFGSGWGEGGGFAKAKASDESLANNAPPAPPQARGNVTEGNRSGDTTVTRNSIDSILNNPAATVQKGEEMKGLEALRNELVDSPAYLSHELKGGAMQDRIEPLDGIVKAGNGALGLEPGNAPSEGEADPFAEAGAVSGLAQREVIRRQEAVVEADRNLLGGRNAYADGDYGQAVDKYKEALQQLPESPATEERRRSYTQHLNDASLARAQELRKIGKYDDARELLKQAEAAAPEDGRIKQEIAYLDDPIRTNPALTYEHQKSVDEVRRKLYMAESNFNLGKFDDAKKTYEDTLRIDPYNKAARRGIEKIDATKSDYYRAAYDHTRAELLAEVDKDWELEIPDELPTESKDEQWGFGGAQQADHSDSKAIDDVTYGQARAGVDVGAPRHKMDLRPGSERTDQEQPNMTTLFSNGKESGGLQWSGSAGSDYLDLDSQNADRSVFKYANDSNPFADEAFDGFANYGAPIDGKPKGVKITTKFTEVTQANDEELGFDWVFSPFKDASVITKSGAAANLEVIREFGYPSEYEPPELPSSETSTIAGALTIPVTPATPTEFDSRLTGTEGEVLPVLEDIPGLGRLFSKQQPIDLADLSNEIPAEQEPFSTFSLNISDASFQVASSAVAKGDRPDPESIKPEQFYNAVSYDDPAPSTGEPVAAAIGQVAHPVIPGRNLVRMSVRTASTGRAATQPLVLTLLVDQSGSMARGDRRAAMDKALTQLATLMQPDDRITVIGFSRTANLLADSLPGDEAAKLPDIINQSSSEGGTNLEQAINLAENLALRHKADGAQNRIVLFTDGAANLGNADPERLAGRVKALRQQDLAFDIAGIGTDDINDRLLSELARHGNGRYYLVGENTGESLAKQLAGAFRPAAENVKIQVKFNPQRVGNYKLIGFEKDRLKTEDFRNDAVDAAELAADESGTALYQVEPLADGTGEIGELFVRFRDTATGEMVERSWTIPYEAQAPAIDKAQPPMQLATLSMLAAQKLQPGPLADAINFRDLAPTIAAVKQAYSRSPEAQQMITLINALK